MDDLIAGFLIFFATIDPIGTLTLFVGLTARASAAERTRIAFRAVGFSTLILLGFVVLGQLGLGYLGIRLAAFQLAGGIIFFLFGVQMVFGTGAAAPTNDDGGDIAISPLAVPSIASPGAILAAVVLTDNREFSIPDQAITTGLMLSVLGLTLLLLLQANRIHRLLGTGGSILLVRVAGLVLSGLAVEMVIDAVSELLPSLQAG